MGYADRLTGGLDRVQGDHRDGRRRGDLRSTRNLEQFQRRTVLDIPLAVRKIEGDDLLPLQGTDHNLLPLRIMADKRRDQVGQDRLQQEGPDQYPYDPCTGVARLPGIIS